MSLEQTFAQKLNLEPEVSSSSTSTQSGSHSHSHSTSTGDQHQYQHLSASRTNSGSGGGTPGGGSGGGGGGSAAAPVGAGAAVTFKNANGSNSNSLHHHSHSLTDTKAAPPARAHAHAHARALPPRAQSVAFAPVSQTYLNCTSETNKSGSVSSSTTPISSLSPASPSHKSSFGNRTHFSSGTPAASTPTTTTTSGTGGGTTRPTGSVVQFASVVQAASSADGKRNGSSVAEPAGAPVSGKRSRSRSSSPSPSTPVDRVHSVKLTRKIFNNWRSACGKTKDKTKDFIRRWKTLPENHPDFENAMAAAQQNSSAGGGPASGSGRNRNPSIFMSSGLGQSESKLRNLVKKGSEIEMGRGSSIDHHEDPGGCSGVASFSQSQPKTSTGWSVHVWATWVQRGSCDEDLDNEAQPEGREFLSEFQKVKLTHFFSHVLDMNHDDVISAEDFVALNQRIRHYIEWSSECIEFHILKEVHSGFLECFLNQPLDDCSHMYYCSAERETRHHVNVDEWLDVWGHLLHPSRSLLDLPLWLQYFPKILFQVINKSGSGTISKEELRAFYTMFLGIDFRLVNETMDVIYNAMTDKGQCKIDYRLFKLCFTNFLLAKHPHGPGQYLFGICSPQTLVCSFPIDYSALNTAASDLEPYDPEKDKSKSNRRSVIV